MSVSKHERWFKDPDDPRDSLTKWTEELELTSKEDFEDGKPVIKLPQNLTYLDDKKKGGIYRILQSEDHQYSIDKSRVINIGMVESASRGSENTLRGRMKQKFSGSKGKQIWVPVAEKNNLSVQFRWFSKRGGNRNYRVTEDFLLKMFENKYGEIPRMNSQASSTKDKVYSSIANVPQARRVTLPIKQAMKNVKMLEGKLLGKDDVIFYHDDDEFEEFKSDLFDKYIPESKSKFLTKSKLLAIHRYSGERSQMKDAGIGGTCWVLYFTDKFVYFYNLVGRKRPEDYIVCRYEDISIEEGISKRGLSRFIPLMSSDDLFLTSKDIFQHKISHGFSVGVAGSLKRLALISLQVRLDS